VQPARVEKILADWSAGAIAGPALTYEILMLAAETDAEKLFTRLPANVQAIIREAVSDPPGPRAASIELFGGTYCIRDQSSLCSSSRPHCRKASCVDTFSLRSM
jgi:hypothetical protein